MDLCIVNGARVATSAVGTYSLSLPFRLVVELYNFYHVPAISINIISISCFDNTGYSFMIKNERCFIYLNDIFYDSAHMSFGLNVLDFETLTYNINTKRPKASDSNISYL